MWVSDLGRSRLEVAGREVLALQSEGLLQKGDRASLFVFGATAIRKAHLSPNIDRMVDIAGKLGRPATLTGDAFPWDSDLAGALERIYQSLDAQDRFEAGADRGKWTPLRRRDRAIVLLTDGDFTVDAGQSQRIDAALAELRSRGIAIYPIGVGTRRGEELTEILRHLTPGRDYDPSLPGELEGQRTRLSMVTLSSLADRTGGKTFTIESLGGSAVAFLREVIESHRNISFQMTRSAAQAGRLALLRRRRSAGVRLRRVDVLTRSRQNLGPRQEQRADHDHRRRRGDGHARRDMTRGESRWLNS